MTTVYTADMVCTTASFRYPNLISGDHLTLEVPPLSTIVGLITAAAGDEIDIEGLEVAYFFSYSGKSVDLETIYMRESRYGKPSNYAKPNIIRRETLNYCFLRLYFKDPSMLEYFHMPVYNLVLGRSDSLITVLPGLGQRSLAPVRYANKIKGQIIPFLGNYLLGTVQPLAQYFTREVPRQPQGIQPYSIINCERYVEGDVEALRDNIYGQEVDIYFHKISTVK